MSVAEPLIQDDVGAHPDSPRRARRHNDNQGAERGDNTSKMNQFMEQFLPVGSPAAKRDRGLLLAVAMTTVVLGLQYNHTLLAVSAGVVAALDLQVLILWSFFVGSVLNTRQLHAVVYSTPFLAPRHRHLLIMFSVTLMDLPSRPLRSRAQPSFTYQPNLATLQNSFFSSLLNYFTPTSFLLGLTSPLVQHLVFLKSTPVHVRSHF